MKSKVVYLLAGCLWVVQAVAGEFVNLDLESVNRDAVVGQIGPSGYLVGSGPVKDLLPGWKLVLHRENAPPPSPADIDVQVIGFNELTALCFGAPCFSIDSREAFSDAARYGLTEMTGEYAFAFDLGTDASGYSLVLAQRGDVPVGATALFLDAALPGGRAEVRLDGTLVYTNNFGSPRLQDISAFGGKTVDLQIRLHGGGFFGTGGGLDAVRFAMGPSDMKLKAARIPEEGGRPEHTTLQFIAVTGRDYFVEYRDSLGSESSWQTLPGGPHNSGSVDDYTSNPRRFYRVRSYATSP